VTSSSGNSAVR